MFTAASGVGKSALLFQLSQDKDFKFIADFMASTNLEFDFPRINVISYNVFNRISLLQEDYDKIIHKGVKHHLNWPKAESFLIIADRNT